MSPVFTELSNHPKSVISRERNNSCVSTSQKGARIFFFKGEKDADIVTGVSQCCATVPLKRVKQPFSESSLALSPLKSDAKGWEGCRGEISIRSKRDYKSSRAARLNPRSGWEELISDASRANCLLFRDRWRYHSYRRVFRRADKRPCRYYTIVNYHKRNPSI